MTTTNANFRTDALVPRATRQTHTRRVARKMKKKVKKRAKNTTTKAPRAREEDVNQSYRYRRNEQ
jgi:hypothetical protein